MWRFEAQEPLDDHSYLNKILQMTEGDNAYRLIPFAIGLLSTGTLIARTTAHYASKARRREEGIENDAYDEAERHSNGIVSRNGGSVVTSFMVARILGCTVLSGFSLLPLIRSFPGIHPFNDDVFVSECTAAVNAYALILASLAFVCQSQRAWLIRHNITILVSELGIDAYRNVWPLATYAKEPADRAEGWLVWEKLGTLVFTGVIIPLFIPTVYTPVDPKRPEKVPNPEQTASLFSYCTYSYITPVIRAAEKVAHLPASELPPLADYDRAQDLIKHAEPYLSPTKVRKGHIFFGLVRCFSLEYTEAFAAMIVYPVTSFVVPLAINRLLTILQSGGKNATGAKPWFWILLILLAPLLGTLSFQYYIIAMTRALVTTESILLQLVFDYSLRVRVKAESSEKGKGASASADATGEGSPTASKTGTSSFIGRLTNLVTIDLDNITRARDMVLLFWNTPVQIIGSAVFLYFILGWSAFVGFGLTIALLPVPGWLTSVTSGVQDEKMKTVGGRCHASKRQC